MYTVERIKQVIDQIRSDANPDDTDSDEEKQDGPYTVCGSLALEAADMLETLLNNVLATSL